MLRCIREVSPRWIVGENVRGLTNWNGGMVFDEVQADLEAIGYEVLPFLLPACAVNAPHRRDRIWFIAHSGLQRQTERQQQPMGIKQLCKEQNASNPNNNGLNERNSNNEVNASEGGINALSNTNESNGNDGIATDTKQQRRKRPDIVTKSKLFKQGTWDNWPTIEPTIRIGDDGISDLLDAITFSKWRNESIKAGGNAVVPQVVYQIFKAIHTFETQNLKP